MTFWYVPAMHAVQVLLPTSAVEKPLGQSVQVGALGGEYMPAPHEAHLTELSREYVPAPQLLHRVALMTPPVMFDA